MTDRGDSSTHLIPTPAVREWLALAAALEEAGASGCQSTAMPEAWWMRSLESQALEVCQRCPARGPCLDYALAADERFGVWGGMTEVERLDLRRRAS